MCVAKWIQTWQRPKLSTNEVKICHLQHQFLPPSLLTQFCLHPTRWQACYAPPSPLSAPVPRLRLMACGGWCLWVMPQENVFHNLLFLLEKRRKRGEGTQTKQTREEREMERGRWWGARENEWHQACTVGEACAVQSSDRRVGRVTERHRGTKLSTDVVGCI